MPEPVARNYDESQARFESATKSRAKINSSSNRCHSRSFISTLSCHNNILMRHGEDIRAAHVWRTLKRSQPFAHQVRCKADVLFPIPKELFAKHITRKPPKIKKDPITGFPKRQPRRKPVVDTAYTNWFAANAQTYRERRRRALRLLPSEIPPRKLPTGPWSETTFKAITGDWNKDEPDRQEVEAAQEAEEEHYRGWKLCLRNPVEARLDEFIPKAFDFDTTKSVKNNIAEQIRPGDLYERLPAFIQRDVLNSKPIGLLWSALNSILPKDPDNENVSTARGRFDFSGPTFHNPRNALSLGWHLPMFPYPLQPYQLLPDGTDTRFLPGHARRWQYRVWSSGSINLHRPKQALLDLDDARRHHMIERPTALQLTSDEKGVKAFVTVTKSFYSLEERLSYLRGRTLGYSTVSKVKDLLSLFPKTPATSHRRNGFYLEENYTLCFMETKPTFLADAPRMLRPPLHPRLSHTFTPNRHLLFLWSSLTQNAHLIHLDRTYAQEQYGASDLLVHGPLTVFLILEWFRRALKIYVKGRLPDFEMANMSYRNVQPLYVNEPMKLCAKPAVGQEPGTLSPQWDIWIEKRLKEKVGDDEWTLAFKGQVNIMIDKVLPSQAGFAEPDSKSPFGI